MRAADKTAADKGAAAGYACMDAMYACTYIHGIAGREAPLLVRFKLRLRSTLRLRQQAPLLVVGRPLPRRSRAPRASEGTPQYPCPRRPPWPSMAGPEVAWQEMAWQEVVWQARKGCSRRCVVGREHGAWRRWCAAHEPTGARPPSVRARPTRTCRVSTRCQGRAARTCAQGGSAMAGGAPSSLSGIAPVKRSRGL